MNKAAKTLSFLLLLVCIGCEHKPPYRIPSYGDEKPYNAPVVENDPSIVQMQLVIVFVDFVSYSEAVKAIQEAGGEVVEQIPQKNCYLVNICVSMESTFIQKLQANYEINWVRFNSTSPNHGTLYEINDQNNGNNTMKELTIEGVLKMYLLDSSGGGDIMYYADQEGNVIEAVGVDDLEHPYCQAIYEYRETDSYNTSLAFVVETDKAFDVTPYMEKGDEVFLGTTIQRAIMVVPRFKYSERVFSAKYANKRVRVTGTLYVPAGGWRNATEVVMDLTSIELVNNAEYRNTGKNNNNTSTLEKPNEFSDKSNCGMGWFDYSVTISYSENLFKSKSIRHMYLPNGDVIEYQYVYECDIFPEYYMKYSLANGEDITSKYSIVLVKTLRDEDGYVGKDKNGYIDMRISYFGFDPDSKSNMIVLIRKK